MQCKCAVAPYSLQKPSAECSVSALLRRTDCKNPRRNARQLRVIAIQIARTPAECSVSCCCCCCVVVVVDVVVTLVVAVVVLTLLDSLALTLQVDPAGTAIWM